MDLTHLPYKNLRIGSSQDSKLNYNKIQAFHHDFNQLQPKFLRSKNDKELSRNEKESKPQIFKSQKESTEEVDVKSAIEELQALWTPRDQQTVKNGSLFIFETFNNIPQSIPIKTKELNDKEYQNNEIESCLKSANKIVSQRHKSQLNKMSVDYDNYKVRDKTKNQILKMLEESNKKAIEENQFLRERIHFYQCKHEQQQRKILSLQERIKQLILTKKQLKRKRQENLLQLNEIQKLKTLLDSSQKRYQLTHETYCANINKLKNQFEEAKKIGQSQINSLVQSLNQRVKELQMIKGEKFALQKEKQSEQLQLNQSNYTQKQKKNQGYIVRFQNFQSILGKYIQEKEKKESLMTTKVETQSNCNVKRRKRANSSYDSRVSETKIVQEIEYFKQRNRKLEDILLINEQVNKDLLIQKQILLAKFNKV